MNKQRREQIGIAFALLAIGAGLLIFLPEASTAGILLGVWGLIALCSKRIYI